MADGAEQVGQGLHRELFERSPDAIFITARNAAGEFHLLDANPAWQRLTGKPLAQARGLPMSVLMPAAHGQRLIERFHECLRRQGRVEFQEQLTGAVGTRRVQITLSLLTDLAEPHILGIAREVSDVQGVARRLSLVEAVLNQVGDAVYLVDEHGRLRYVNDQACGMLGYDRASLLGLAVWDVSPEWSAQRWFKAWSEQNTRGQRKFETQLRSRDGCLMSVAVTASSVVLQGGHHDLLVVRDIGERRRAHERLQDSERRYRDIFNHVSDSLYLLEVTEDGQFRNLEVNPAFELATGLSAERLIGKFVTETVSAEAGELVVAKYQRCVAAGHPIDEEVELDLPSGLRVFHSTLIPMRDAQGRIHRIIGLSRDITEARRTADMFRALVEHSPDTVSRYDLDRRRVYVNPALARAAGLSAEAMLGKRPGADVSATPEMAQRYEACVAEVLATGRDAVLDLSWRGAGGLAILTQLRLVAERGVGGAITSVLVIGRDIGALMETQRQLRAMIEAHPDIVVRHDTAGRIVYVSANTAQRLGRPPAWHEGKTMVDINARLGRPLLQAVQQVVASGLPRILEQAFPVCDELRHWEFRYMPEFNDQGQVTGVLGLTRDITERHEAERKIRDLHQQREGAREDERRHIARELHDELGQHLSALRLEASVLRMRWGGNDPALRERTNGLRDSVDQVIQVVRDLVSSLRPAVLDLGILPALEWLAEEFSQRNAMACHLQVDDAGLTLDAQQTVTVFRMVQESLTNVSKHARAQRVDVVLQQQGGDIVLMVRDDGCGFDPAHRSSRSLGLVGLGERAQMLGGQLDIRSSPGAGTTIILHYPHKPRPGA